MRKARKGGGGIVNIWSLKEKHFGMKFVNTNILALKYGRDMETEAVNTFAEYIKTYQQDLGLHYFRMLVGLRRNHAIHWGMSRLVNVMLVLW